MVSKRFAMRLGTGLIFWSVCGLAAQAQLPAMTVESACQITPTQPGVAITTPAAAQLAQCKIETIPNPQNAKSPMGYVVRDGAGKLVRQFVSYDGKSFNIRSFYLDGVEAYREAYPLQQNEPAQFRWLGPNGSKWGLDHSRNGKIDEWYAISPEELSQELLAAVLARDTRRAEALALNKNDLVQLGYKGAEAEKLLARTGTIGKKLLETAQALNATPETHWVHLEMAAPQVTPADAFNGRFDLVVYKSGTILVQDGKSTKFIQTGEVVQVGRAWKLIDGPGGDIAEAANGNGSIPAEIAALVPKLNELDQNAQSMTSPEAITRYNASRVDILEQIVGRLPFEKQEQWLRLLVDALSAASEGEKSDGRYISRLRQIRDVTAKSASPALASFAGYRYLIAENNIAISGGPTDFGALQEKWRASLEEFFKAYSNSEEAPEALLRLAMAYEYQKDGEPKAKEWYNLLSQKYPNHPHATKARGAIKRLDSEGKTFELAGTTLEGSQAFNVSTMQNRVVVVFYCASWSRSLAADAAKLQALVKQYGGKGLELVTVCLDNDPRQALDAVTKNGVPGTHLFAPGGLDSSPLASGYGVLVLPHLFIVKDGKVVNRNAQITTLEDDLKKLMP